MGPLMDQRKVLALTRLDDPTLMALGDEARAVGCDLERTPDGKAALQSLSTHPPTAVLVDFEHEDAQSLCQSVRSKRRSVDIAIFALSRLIDDPTFLRALVAGADDLIDPRQPGALGARLVALPVDPTIPSTRGGNAMVAVREPALAHLVGRVLTNAGYAVEYARDALTLRQTIGRPGLRLVVTSRDFDDLKESAERMQRSGQFDMGWVVLVNAADLRQAEADFAGIPNLGVVSRNNPLDDILYVANEITSAKRGAEARLGPRVSYGTAVRFGNRSGAAWDWGFSWNVGPHGLYVRTLAPPLDDAVDLELRAPGSDRTLSLSGELVWQRGFGRLGTSTAPPGFGIRITGGSANDRTAWAEACLLLAHDRRESGAFLVSERELLCDEPASQITPRSTREPGRAEALGSPDLGSPLLKGDLADAPVASEPFNSAPVQAAPALPAANPDLIAPVPFHDPRFQLPRIGGSPPAHFPQSVFGGAAAQAASSEDLPSVVVNSPTWQSDAPETIRRIRSNGPGAELAHGTAKPTPDQGSRPRPMLLVGTLGLSAFITAFAVFTWMVREGPSIFGARAPAHATIPGPNGRPAPVVPSLPASAARQVAEPTPAAPAVLPVTPTVEPVTSAASQPQTTPPGNEEAAAPEIPQPVGVNDPQAGETKARAGTEGSAPVQAPAMPGPSASSAMPLLSFEGYLEVDSPLDTLVFAHGIKVGRTNQPNKVPCGLRYVRLGTAPGHWQSPGHTVNIRCQETTQLRITPGR